MEAIRSIDNLATTLANAGTPQVYALVDAALLTEPEYNPRRLDQDDALHIARSLRKFGLVGPLVVNCHEGRAGVAVGGSQRLGIIRQQPVGSVPGLVYEGNAVFIPCVLVNLPEQEERELNLRLNKNQGKWDFKILNNEFKKDFLLDLGFKSWDLGLPAQPATRLPEPGSEPKSGRPKKEGSEFVKLELSVSKSYRDQFMAILQRLKSEQGFTNYDEALGWIITNLSLPPPL